MKDFHKLSKATGKLYPAMFLAAVLFMLINTVYICIDRTGIKVGQSIEQTITTSVNDEKAKNTDQSYTLPEQGLDLSEAIYYKGKEFLGFISAMFGIILLLVIREISMNDRRTREFELTLPVKKSALVMHEYWFFFILITSMTLLQGVILAAFQKHYNDVWVRVSGIKAPEGFTSIPTEKLYMYIAFYTVSLLIGFTWIYLGMTTCRNSLLGIVISIGTWLGSILIYANFGNEIVDILMNVFVGRCPGSGNATGNIVPYSDHAFELWNSKYYFIDNFMESIFSIDCRFDYIRELIEADASIDGAASGFRDVYDIVPYNITFAKYMVILGIILIIGIVLIGLAARKRQLSDGGRFTYFATADYLFALFCGVVWFSVFTDFVVYGFADDYGILFLFDILSTITVIVLVAFLIHPIKIDKGVNFNTKQRMLVKVFSGDKEKKSRKCSDMGQQIAKLIYYEGIRCVLFLAIGIIIVYALIEMHSYYHNIISGSDYDIEQCLMYLDILSNNIINHFQGEILCAVIIVLIISKLSGYWLERKSDTRDFFNTIPVKRGVKSVFSIVKDLLITIIPIIIAGVIIFHQAENALAYMEVNLEWLSKAIMGMVIADIGYAVMIVGLMHLIEEIFPNGVMRLIGFLGFVLMTVYSLGSLGALYKNVPLIRYVYEVLTLKMPGSYHFFVNAMSGIYAVDFYKDVPVLYRGDVLTYGDYLNESSIYDVELGRLYNFSDPSMYISYTIFFIIVGVVLFALAHIWSKKKDFSSYGLYFEFQKYPVAAVISLNLFCILQPFVVALWHRLLIVVACVVVFALLIYMMTPRKNKKYEKN